MRKIIAIATIAVMAMAVPAMAHGGHHGNRINASQCTRVCTNCSGTVSGGVCTNCGANQRQYSNLGTGQCQYNNSSNCTGNAQCYGR